MYKYYNPDEFKNDIDACIPRALNCALNTHFKNIPEVKEKWRFALMELGFKYISVKAIPFKKRLTVRELAESADKDSIIICSCADHVVCIKNNTYYDTVDSGDKCVFFYFERRLAENVISTQDSRN